MAQRRFGSAESTGRKLEVIEQYLSMYQSALKLTGLRTLYVDGFAGTGEVPLTENRDLSPDADVNTVLSGSAERALKVDPPFDRYIFIDNRRKCIAALKERFKNSANGHRVTYAADDANSVIKALCANEQWKAQRGVVLLDPFGSQVDWSTIQAIAATKALDLWYLFPAGLSVFRQIGNDGLVHDTHAPSINRIYGTDAWQSAFLTPSRQEDLFGGPPKNEKTVTPESAADFMQKRLGKVFEGGVLDQMIPLGQHSYASYYLLFAWGNPSPKATALAAKLSKAAIKAVDRKHGRIV